MKSPLILQGLLTASLALAGFTGCQKAEDAGSYREYSDLKNTGGEAADEKSPAGNAANKKTPRPAVAEKSDQPAIAQASYERTAAKTTEPVSVNSAGSKARSRPGQLTLAEPDGLPREFKLLIPEKRFTKASADGTLRVSYDDIDLLKILNANPVPLDVTDYFPGWLEQLEGQRIRIRGFMYPEFQETGLRGFILARDNDICCFGRDPKIYDLIRVIMKEGTTTNYLPNRPFDVEGTFHIIPEADGDTLFRLYEIRDAVVITGR